MLMNAENRLKYIRECERKSHETMYANEELFQEGSWLQKPIKTILDLIPLFVVTYVVKKEFASEVS